MHYACMATSVTIRNVPDEVRDELAARANLAGQSLQEFLRSELIAMAQRPSVPALLQQIRARKAAIGGELSTSDILSYRDEDRR